MKSNHRWTSVLHHTNYGGCEKLALGFLKEIKSDLIVFHERSEVVNPMFNKISNQKWFTNRVSIRNLSSILQARALVKPEIYEDRRFILWHGRYSLLASVLILYQRNAKFLVHIGTNVDEVTVTERISMKILNRLFRKQIKFICVSAFNRETFLAKFPYFENRTYVIPNGISPSKLDNQGTFSDFKYAMISRFDNSKYQDLIIKAFITGSVKEKVLFIGDGENLLKCKRICESSGNAEQFKFTGNLDEPFSVLNRNQLFVFAADEREGFGLVIYEAISSGLRVIASDIPAVRQIIKDERFLFSNDQESLLKAINYAQTNERAHSYYMDSLNLKITTEYSLPFMHQRYLELW
jgi:glycosyltransferase involved in cell wall biosynthesis